MTIFGIIASFLFATRRRQQPTPTGREAELIRTRFCSMPHRLKDGVPIAHRCKQLPVEALRAELKGDKAGAVRIFGKVAARGPLPENDGTWKIRRR